MSETNEGNDQLLQPVSTPRSGREEEEKAADSHGTKGQSQRILTLSQLFRKICQTRYRAIYKLSL